MKICPIRIPCILETLVFIIFEIKFAIITLIFKIITIAKMNYVIKCIIDSRKTIMI